MMLPPKPNFWQQFLETFNPNQIAQGAMMGMQEKRRRRELASNVIQKVLSGEIPEIYLGTEAGQAMIKELRIENEPGIRDISARAKILATVPATSATPSVMPGGEPLPLARMPGEAPGPAAPPGGTAYMFPEVPEHRMNVEQAQQAAIKREFGIKMGQENYKRMMDLEYRRMEKEMDLYFKELELERKPQQIFRMIQKTRDALEAAHMNWEGITVEGVTVPGPYREKGRELEEKRLFDEEFRSYRTAVEGRNNFMFAGAKSLADMRTGKSGNLALFNFSAPGTDMEIISQGQYIKDPQKRYQFMLSMINRGIEDWNKVVSDTEKQYRLRPTKPFEPINDNLLSEISDIEGRSGKSIFDMAKQLGIGKLFDKAKSIFYGPSQGPVQTPTPQMPNPTGQEIIIVNPTTGERMKLVNGQWIKI